ncbi:hypothetical protein NQD34_011365 [Periophthalmus magnuspinnatus]|nr:hypothetical protein NQD34_011365 [Periophthalmus magnuspinnatus]
MRCLGRVLLNLFSLAAQCRIAVIWPRKAISYFCLQCDVASLTSIALPGGGYFCTTFMIMHPMAICSVSGGDIFDCIQRGNLEQCIHFIQNDRSILKQKGWGGFTPLHYAALHGSRSMVDLFLSNGADPNLTCDAGQTAFQFACRQGNIYIIHQMMQYGADLRIIDLQGKTSLHHAVTGGNIVAVHYLWETGMFRFCDTDMYKVTPLHLAASTGNTEVVRYLLRDQRCAVEAVDQQGATALHVAAERGGVEVCWTLLQKAGCRMLHQKNHSGLTPLDLCKQGKTFRHQQLTKLLSRYINEPLYQKPRESHVLYYWTLFFPLLSGAVILLIAAMLGVYGSLICGLLFPWLARSIFTQYHRMTTYQRLPNPVYLGTLIAGLFHSLLCFYEKIMPNILVNMLSMIHFSIVLCLFCKILIQDPGRLKREEANPRFSCIADLVENNQSHHRFCPYCELFLPDNTKHCKLCDVCIKDYDHHCLFLNPVHWPAQPSALSSFYFVHGGSSHSLWSNSNKLLIQQKSSGQPHLFDVVNTGWRGVLGSGLVGNECTDSPLGGMATDRAI